MIIWAYNDVVPPVFWNGGSDDVVFDSLSGSCFALSLRLRWQLSCLAVHWPPGVRKRWLFAVMSPSRRVRSLAEMLRTSLWTKRAVGCVEPLPCRRVRNVREDFDSFCMSALAYILVAVVRLVEHSLLNEKLFVSGVAENISGAAF